MASKTAQSQKLVGYMMYAVGVGMPLTNLPQIMQIFSTKVTTGLSVSTWIMYTVFGFIPLLYAISNKLKPLIISNILWMFIDALMIYGILRYSPNFIPTDYDKLLHLNNIGKTVNQVGLFCLSIAFCLFAIDLLESRQGHGKR